MGEDRHCAPCPLTPNTKGMKFSSTAPGGGIPSWRKCWMIPPRPAELTDIAALPSHRPGLASTCGSHGCGIRAEGCWTRGPEP